MVSFYVLHFFTSDIWMKSPNLYSSLRRHVRPAGIFRLCNKSRTSTDFSADEISACFSTDSFLGAPGHARCGIFPCDFCIQLSESSKQEVKTRGISYEGQREFFTSAGQTAVSAARPVVPDNAAAGHAGPCRRSAELLFLSEL